MVFVFSPLLAVSQSNSRYPASTAECKTAPSKTTKTKAKKDTPMLPLFYKSIELVDLNKHAQLGISQTQNQFSFAAATNIVPIVISEITFAMAHYPLVFIMEGGASTPALVALVGNGDGKNQFVSATGAWRAQTYIPAWVRRYPFILVNQNAQSPNTALAFDPASDLLNDKHPVKLLKESQATEALNGILAFQRNMASALEATAAAAKALNEAQVLEASGLTFTPPDGQTEPQKVSGFMLVNESKLLALNGAALEKLNRTNALSLAYAQLFSMKNLQNLTAPH
jgi:hypothetical protein